MLQSPDYNQSAAGVFYHLIKLNLHAKGSRKIGTEPAGEEFPVGLLSIFFIALKMGM